MPWGSTPIRSITDRPSLAPSSLTRRPVGNSCESLSMGQGPMGDDGLTTFRVCSRCVWFRSLLSAGGSTSAPQGVRSPTVLATYLLVQAIQQLALGLCDDGYDASPELTLPHDPGSRPPHAAGSRNVPRGSGCHPRRDEATLSRKLRTPRSPATHVPVGDCWQNSR